MFPIQNLSVHLFQGDFRLNDQLEAFEKQIIARKEQLNLTKNKIENLKASMIGEFKQIFPQYIDRQLISIIESNANIINEIPEEKLDKFRKDVLVAKENSIKRIIDELSKSVEWYSCEKRGMDIGGGLWKIIKSIEKEFLPIFSELDLKARGRSVFGGSDLTPLNLDDFESIELKRLNEDLINILEDYCGKEDGLKELQNNIAKKKALDRWKNTSKDSDEKFVQSSKYQLDY